MAGGASFDDHEEEAITGINVAPLVDVMLVLLVIFMVTATYIVNQSININLPKTEVADQAATQNLAFVLDDASQLFLDGQPITYEELTAKIAEAREKDQGTQLQALISADKATPHGSVIRLIDAIRKNGISDFAISVEVAAETP